MHLPIAAQSASTAVVPQPPEITFNSAGSTFQRSAFSIFKQSFGPVSYAGDEVAEYGQIYEPYRSTSQVIDGTISLSGCSALARAKNLTVLSRKLGGRSANNRLSEVSRGLLAAVNQRDASNESQKIGSRLIGMQFQLAGLSTTHTGYQPLALYARALMIAGASSTLVIDLLLPSCVRVSTADQRCWRSGCNFWKPVNQGLSTI